MGDPGSFAEGGGSDKEFTGEECADMDGVRKTSLNLFKGEE